MASPSRSGSVASSTPSDLAAASFSSFTSFSLPLMTLYLGLKWSFTSTQRRALGRSRTWPMEATTS